MKRGLKGKGKFFFRNIPYTFLTKKPLEVRMGKGKGNHYKWVCPVKKGTVFVEFEIYNMNFLDLLNLIRKCRKRLPLKLKIISKSKKSIKNDIEKNFNKIFL